MKAFLEKTFPFLSVAANNPDGPIGMAGAQVLSTTLGREVKPSKVILELSTLALTSAEDRAKAQQAELEFSHAMKQLGFEKSEDLESVAKADQEPALRPGQIKDAMPVVLSVFVNALFFLSILFLMFREIPTTSRDVILILMGALVGGWKDVFGFYFGSSAGSSKKDATIENLTK